MAFIQIIEFRTSRTDELRRHVEEWERSTQGRRKARRRVLCQDRENPGRYLNLVFFDSYDDAMANSTLPETDALATQLRELADGAPNFYNLDVEDDREM
ncbi:MAG TPA: hypothetical protein VMF60_08395 [Acidimicrobiales bacterium]|nr:hypothetical protein [Acidimicrobiales bacterium]